MWTSTQFVRSWTAAAAVPLAACLLAGCRAPLTHAPASRPEDFALAVTVTPRPGLVTVENPDPWVGLAPYARPARYVLEVDGTLRADFGPGVREPGFPGGVRWLSEPERDALYALAAQQGLLTVNAPGFQRAAEAVSPPTEEAFAVASFSLDGRHLGVTARIEDDADPASAALRPLVVELARLTWLR